MSLYYGCGTVFELVPNATKTEWTETVYYSFCPNSNTIACPDGYQPFAGLIMDGSGNLYGTTFYGGANYGGTYQAGTVFELVPNAAKTKWREKVLHRFCANDTCIDGKTPYGGLTMDNLGNLYGTTSARGANDASTVFELIKE